MNRLLTTVMSAGMLLAAISPAILSAKTIYVDASVQTSGDGSTPKKAFKTVQEAADVAKTGDVVEIAGGRYRESVTIKVKGKSDAGILFRAKSGNVEDRVIIDGTDPIDAVWTVDEELSAYSKSGKVTGRVWVADVVMPLGSANQLFIGDRMQFLAQWPDRAGEGVSLNGASLSDLFMKQAFSETQEGSGSETVIDSELPSGLDLTGAFFSYKGTAEWSGWHGPVTGTVEGGFRIKNASPNKYEVVSKGEKYYISNSIDLLNVPGEWYYDEQTRKLYLCLNEGEDPNDLHISMKTRTDGLRFTYAAYVTVENVDIFGANIVMESGSRHCTVDRMEAYYLNHDLTGRSDRAIDISGEDNAIWNSILAYTFKGGIVIYGKRNKVINCYVHDIDYGITGAGAFSPYGEDAVIFHNTVHNVPRSMIGGSGGGGRIAYNHLYDCGMLTKDCGMIYFGTCDGGGMEIDHNVVHGNRSPDNAMGIYFDCGSQNFSVHHNVMYDIVTYGLSFNVPSQNFQVYNNTIYNTCGSMNDWGWAKLESYKNDQNGTYVLNNILDYTHYRGNKKPMLFTLSPTAVVKTQIASPVDQKSEDLFNDPDNGDFTLLSMKDTKATERTRMAHKGGTAIDGLINRRNSYIGAYDPKAKEAWKAGCTTDTDGNPAPADNPLDRIQNVFKNESGDVEIDLSFPMTNLQFNNHVYNSSFERGDRGWTKTGAKKTAVIDIEKGVSSMHLGDNKNGGKMGKENVRSARRSLRLGDTEMEEGISQKITTLKPKTRYAMSAWAKIDKGQKLVMGVLNYDVDSSEGGYVVEIASEDTNDGVWKRYAFEFETDRNTSATIYLKAANTFGYISVDDITVQALP